MFYYTDPQEQVQNQLVASRVLDSECERARSSHMAHGSDAVAQVPARLRSLEETARYMCWIIGSAFEDGLARFVSLCAQWTGDRETKVRPSGHAGILRACFKIVAADVRRL